MLDSCENFSVNKANLYSFELKKSITIETLREQFFQVVSNSSEANQGYLVGVDIDTSNEELIQEINRLSSAFNIGGIKLNLPNPEGSEILEQSTRKYKLDGEKMNKIISINKHFKGFVQTVLKSIQVNEVVISRLGEIYKKEQLIDILRKD